MYRIYQFTLSQYSNWYICPHLAKPTQITLTPKDPSSSPWENIKIMSISATLTAGLSLIVTPIRPTLPPRYKNNWILLSQVIPLS